MSKVAEILLNEHKVLFDVIETAKRIQKIKNIDKYRRVIHKFITFFIQFTEVYHHPKEELILYPQILKLTKNIDQKIIREMSGNHNEIGVLIRKAEEAFINEKNKELKIIIKKYLDLLFKHIWRENLIIFVNLGHLLSGEDNLKMIKRFNRLDGKGIGKDKLEKSIYKYMKSTDFTDQRS